MTDQWAAMATGVALSAQLPAAEVRLMAPFLLLFLATVTFCRDLQQEQPGP